MAEKKALSKEEIYKEAVERFSQSAGVSYNEQKVEIARVYKKRTPEEVARYMLKNEISDSDILMIHAIHMLGFATIEGVMIMLNALKEKHPNIIYPNGSDKEGVSQRLYACTEAGLIGKICHRFPDDSLIKFYYVVDNGFEMIRKRLMKRVYGDAYLGATNITDMCGFIGNSIVTQYLLSKVSHLDWSMNFRTKDMRFLTKKCTPLITHTLYFKNEEGEGMYLVEPMFLEHNSSIITEKDLYSRRTEKIKELYKWSMMAEAEGYAYKIIFVCENLKNALKIADIVEDKAPDIAEKILFTSPDVIRPFSKKGLLDYSCFCVSKSDGKRLLTFGNLDI